MRIGLLGGSFDPVHDGHLQMAKAARKQLHLHEVWFLVSKDTPLKDRLLSAFVDRCKMIEIAITGFLHFKICTIEAQFENKNYTVDTIRLLNKRYPQHSFYFIMGGDQVAQLSQWKDITVLEKMVSLCAFERNHRTIETKYQVIPLTMNAIPISSREIRAGNFLYLTKGVKKFIFEHGLYISFMKAFMNEQRYEHSLSVASLCKKIAAANDMDVHKAYLCGLLHDINKEFKLIDKEVGRKIILIMRPSLISYPLTIWHGYLGAYICSHQFGIQDKDILTAIENHVMGGSKNRYAKLLYVADKLDPHRQLNTGKTIALAMENLNKACKEVHQQQDRYYGKESLSEK